MRRAWRRLNAQPVYVQLLIAAGIVIACSAFIWAIRRDRSATNVSPIAPVSTVELSVSTSTDPLDSAMPSRLPPPSSVTDTVASTTVAATTTITTTSPSALSSSTTSPQTAAPTAPTTAAADAGTEFGLRVTTDHIGGYSRSLFKTWIDADGNGCDTRQEVLIAESVIPPTIGPSCDISGEWRSPYDGLDTADPSQFDIDHVVPLAEAWASGAWAWTPAQRTAYANDLDQPFFLIAVSASSNRSKGDRDPAKWLPPAASFRCTYVLDWVAVKKAWNLSIDYAEASAIQNELNRC